jgi:hypothetical protein
LDIIRKKLVIDIRQILLQDNLEIVFCINETSFYFYNKRIDNCYSNNDIFDIQFNNYNDFIRHDQVDTLRGGIDRKGYIKTKEYMFDIFVTNFKIDSREMSIRGCLNYDMSFIVEKINNIEDSTYQEFKKEETREFTIADLLDLD